MYNNEISSPIKVVAKDTDFIKKNSKNNKSKLDIKFFIRNWDDFLDQIQSEHPKYLTYLSDVKLNSFNDDIKIEEISPNTK